MAGPDPHPTLNVPIGLGLINAPFPWPCCHGLVKAFVHVLALELPQLSM